MAFEKKNYILYLVWILVAGFVIFGEVLRFCLFLKILIRCSSNINLVSSTTPRLKGFILTLIRDGRSLYLSGK